ncbi:ribonuclease T2-like protein [Zopfochytrium polystomum]|nr:ribonuclease T2-like protein [Zopfochytrium polystomum]
MRPSSSSSTSMAASAVAVLAAAASLVAAAYCPTTTTTGYGSGGDGGSTNPLCPATAVGCQKNPLTGSLYDSCCVAVNGLLVFSQNWTAGQLNDANPAHATWYDPSVRSILPQNHWTIHGLWPDNCDGSYNSSELGCDPNRVYNDLETRIKDLEDETLLSKMYKYWLSGNKDYNWFWSHEWTKHATCFSPIDPKCYGADYTTKVDIKDYFSISVKLMEHFNLYKIFADAGVVPSYTTTYYRANFSNALTAATGYRGGIQCVKDAKSNYYVSEVYIYMYSLPDFDFEVVSPDVVNYTDSTGKINRDFQSCPDNVQIIYAPQTAREL